MDWDAETYVEFFRAVEITLRRHLEALDQADIARQKADAAEAHGFDVLDCEIPHNEKQPRR